MTASVNRGLKKDLVRTTGPWLSHLYVVSALDVRLGKRERKRIRKVPGACKNRWESPPTSEHAQLMFDLLIKIALQNGH